MTQTIILMLGSMYVCYRLAEKQGRNPYFALLWGFLFSFLAVIVYLIIGDTERITRQRIKNIIKSNE